MKTSIYQGEYTYVPHFLSEMERNEFYHDLTLNIPWKQESLQLYGREIPFPRLTSFHGDHDCTYTYSKQKRYPEPWTETLQLIKNKIELLIPYSFNCVLLNMYRNGSDSMSWHSDNEPELGINPVIASVNLGAARTLQLKHKTTKERINLLMENGSLLIMEGEMQHHWQHQIPKTKKPIGARINLTFRKII